ncbi:hypothetical protein IKE19_00130 [Candidatus Saccharibacteria bacterium]|nr:hypothetical protein [Candidatus Saccharibacteria bacterium]
MDPQNNNSFGSFGTGMPDGGSNGFGNEMSSDTNVSGQPIVSGPIVSGGATAVDNDNFVSSEFPKGGLSIGGGEKKSRKGLVAGLIVVFVLLVSGGLVVFAAVNGMFGNNGDSGSGNVTNNGVSIVVDESVSMKVAFNRYANYLVSGEVKDTVVNSDAFDGLTVLDEKYNDKEYIKNVNALYDVFYKKFEQEWTAKLPSGVYPMEVKEGFEFLEQRDDVTQLDRNILLDKYNEGEKSVNDYLNSLNDLENEDNSLIYALEEYQKTLGEVLIEYWNVYKANGCITTGVINYDCVRALDETIISKNASDLGRIETRIELLEYNVVGNIKEQSGLILTLIGENK